MILYTVDQGEFITLEESLRRQPQGRRNVYVNITNRCSCACTFCLRQFHKEMAEENTMWLREEPEPAVVKAAFAALDWSHVAEVVFCGFGEPTMRLPVLVELLRYVKTTHPQTATRLNTNGLSDLMYARDTASDFGGGILDTVSISLNASNEARYLQLTRNQFGPGSFEAMLTFAAHCQRYVPEVVMSIVDQVEDAAEIAACRKLCAERGLTLRVRPYEDK